MTEFFGRTRELILIEACLASAKNVLIEGPVGVGKTALALEAVTRLKSKVVRIDGDSRYSEQKLTGWFDPPAVMKKGYTAETFTRGPLVEAMESGAILFINELNRMPEGVQNVLLPAIDERKLIVPRIGEIRAQPGFGVVATQNPKEFVATSHLSEAILDRFELVLVGYQSEPEEIAIVRSKLAVTGAHAHANETSQLTVSLVRATRSHPKIRRGASVRAAISIAEIAVQLQKIGYDVRRSVREAAELALPTRIEIERDTDVSISDTIQELLDATLGPKGEPDGQKKK